MPRRRVSALAVCAQSSCRPVGGVTNFLRGEAPRSRNDVARAFTIPDFVLMESPKLAEMFTSGALSRGERVESVPGVFPGIVTLMKFRWLLKVHIAFVTVGGPRCSLKCFLHDGLASSIALTQYNNCPLMLFEYMIGLLQTRLFQSWSLLLAFIGNMEPPSRRTSSCDSSGPASASPESDGFSDTQSSEGQPLRSARSAHKGQIADITDLKSVQSLVDDLFFAWLVQQNVSTMPAEALFRECDFYGIERPRVQCSFEKLREWYSTRATPSSFRSVPRAAAQRQAQRLALVLELPKYWPLDKPAQEEFLELASGIVAHHQTFNEMVRLRIRDLLERGMSHVEKDGVNSLACDMNETQVKLFLRAAAIPADAGRLSPLVVTSLRDRASPWLVGSESRFCSTSPSLLEYQLTPRRPHTRA